MTQPGSTSTTTLPPSEVARTIVELASDRQASDILMLDIRGVCAFADYFVLCTGINARHLQALAEELDQGVGRLGVTLRHWEGAPQSGWVLLDFGDVIVHLFAAEERERYGLEHLWWGATPVLRMQ